MRVRLWIPLPGPFAVTSGQRRPRQAEYTGTHRRGWFYWPALNTNAGFWTAWFWAIIFCLALVWNVGVAAVLGVAALARTVGHAHHSRPVEAAPEPGADA